ncbi:MAG: VPLPA-CTERM sorting domain-containing protein [Pseudomonadota bacterium]
MSLFRNCAAIAFAATTASVAATSSFAGVVLPDGVYEALNYNEGDPNARGVWSTSLIHGFNSGNEKLWGISDSTFEVSNSGQDAVLKGQARNLADTDLAFNFSITMTSNMTGSNPGYCQFNNPIGGPGAADPGCDSAYSQQLIDDGVIDPTSWAFFDIVADSSSFIGIDGMDGLTYKVSDKTGGSHRAQAGVGGNSFDPEDNGLSFWFDFEKHGVAPDSSIYSFKRTGSGDFNIDLSDGPIPGVVPLPASSLLLLAGLGGFAALRRRKASD